MTRSQDKKDTAYIVAIVMLVCIIAAIALYRSNSSDDVHDQPHLPTPQENSEVVLPSEDTAQENEEVEAIAPEIAAEPNKSKAENTNTLELQLERIRLSLQKAEKKVKLAQQKLNEIVQASESEDTTHKKESKTTTAIKNLLYWQNEVERLNYELENIREKMK